MARLADAIPDELQALERWVCMDVGAGKVPMCAFRDGMASVCNPNTWGTFEEACECVESGLYTNVGFVFADDGYVGIDIDKGVAMDELGMPSPDALEAITACRSYTEVSVSGRGFHIICRGSLPFEGHNNGRGWEIYRTKRYFVLTGHVALFGDVADAQDGIDLVLEHHFSDAPARGPRRGAGRRKLWEPHWRMRDDGLVQVEPDLPDVASGARHIHMVSFAGQMHASLAHPDVTMAQCMRQNQLHMVPPLPEAEVLSIVRSVTRHRR